MRDEYEILGDQVMREMAIGFDWASLVKGTSNVVEKGIEEKQASDAASKAKHDADAAVAKSIAADAEWANAEANCELAQSDSTAYAAAKVVRDTARHEAEVASSALPSEGNTKRCQAAQDQVNRAASAAQSAPKDIAKQAKFHGWQKVSQSCGAPPPGGGGGVGRPPPAGEPSRSFLETFSSTKKAGLPIYGWGLIGVGGLTVLLLLLRPHKGRR